VLVGEVIGQDGERDADERDSSRQATSKDREENMMIAALGIGLIGTILVVVLVIAAILYFVRRS